MIKITSLPEYKMLYIICIEKKGSTNEGLKRFTIFFFKMVFYRIITVIQCCGVK